MKICLSSIEKLEEHAMHLGIGQRVLNDEQSGGYVEEWMQLN